MNLDHETISVEDGKEAWKLYQGREGYVSGNNLAEAAKTTYTDGYKAGYMRALSVIRKHTQRVIDTVGSNES